MTNEEAQKALKELEEVRPEKLNDEAKRLFEAIMKIADERDLLKEKTEKQSKIIQAMAEYIDNTQMEVGIYFKDKNEVIKYFEKKVRWAEYG